MSCEKRSVFLCAAVFPVRAQRRVDPRNTYERILCVVSMVGAGTAADPRRPLDVPLPGQRSPLSREGILAFSFQESDDGRFALVELVARDRAAFAGILAERRPDVKVFEKGKAGRGDIEREFRKHKSGFKLDDFRGVAVP